MIRCVTCRIDAGKSCPRVAVTAYFEACCTQPVRLSAAANDAAAHAIGARGRASLVAKRARAAEAGDAAAARVAWARSIGGRRARRRAPRSRPARHRRRTRSSCASSTNWDRVGATSPTSKWGVHRTERRRLSMRARSRRGAPRERASGGPRAAADAAAVESPERAGRRGCTLIREAQNANTAVAWEGG